MLLAEFDYTMRHVDALSRKIVTTISAVHCSEKMADSEVRTICEILKDHLYENYFLKDDSLYKM